MEDASRRPGSWDGRLQTVSEDGFLERQIILDRGCDGREGLPIVCSLDFGYWAEIVGKGVVSEWFVRRGRMFASLVEIFEGISLALFLVSSDSGEVEAEIFR